MVKPAFNHGSTMIFHCALALTPTAVPWCKEPQFYNHIVTTVVPSLTNHGNHGLTIVEPWFNHGTVQHRQFFRCFEANETIKVISPLPNHGRTMVWPWFDRGILGPLNYHMAQFVYFLEKNHHHKSITIHRICLRLFTERSDKIKHKNRLI